MRLNIKAIIVGIILASLLSPLSISVGEVPITLQTLILFTLAASFGKWAGFLISLIYLVLGAIGLPVFADHESGYELLFGPTAGFLWAFPFVSFIVGWISQDMAKSNLCMILNFLLGHILLFIPGFLVLHELRPEISLWDAFIPLIPGMFAKAILGGLISSWLMKKLPSDWTEVSQKS